MKRSKKLVLLILLSFILGIAVFVLFGKSVGWNLIGQAFSKFNYYQAFLIILITFMISLVGVWRWKEIISNMNDKISFGSLFRLYLGGYAMMYLFPIAILSGELFRIYGLTKENITGPRAVSSVVAERILEWTSNVIIIVLGALFFAFKVYSLPSYIIMIFGIAFFLFFLTLFIFYFNAVKKNSIVSFVIKKFFKKEVGDKNSFFEVESNLYGFFNFTNMALYKGLALSFFRAILMQVRLFLLIAFLGGGFISIFHTFSVLGFAYLSCMVPIPAAIGSYEIMQSFVFENIGLTSSMATAFSMIIRSAEVIVSVLGLFYVIKAGFNFVGSKLNIFEMTEEKLINIK